MAFEADTTQDILRRVFDATRSTLVADIKAERNVTVTNATGTGAISLSYAPSAAFWLENVTLKFNTAPTTSENFVAKVNANDGAGYDTILVSTDPSATVATSIFWIPDRPILCESGDGVDITYTNTDVKTYGLRLVTRLA